METHRRGNAFLVIAALLLLIAGSASCAASKDALGIAPQDVDYYRSNVIKCKDGSSKFTKEQLNDEFCDCPDGTDEPGTSACPEGRFYCQNKGHTPLIIFSSRVNDGICDCCDGSDEYGGKVKCTNTCWEAGKVAREKLTKKIATYQEGIALRKIEVEKAKKAFEHDEAELTKLKTEGKILKGLVERLKEHKEQIEKAEEQERLKREKEEEALKDSEKTVIKDDENEADPHLEEDKDNHADKTKNTEDDKSTEASTSVEEQKQEDPGNTGLSKEELGRLVASRWTGEKTKETNEDETEKQEIRKENAGASENNDENNHGYTSESEESSRKYNDDDDDDEAEHGHSDDEYEDDVEPSNAYHPEPEDDVDVSDFTESSSPSWLDKIQQTVQSILLRINLFKSPVDISEAGRVRKEYDESSSKLSKIQSRISKLTGKLKYDFGGDKEFYLFYDNCFEMKQDKYVYKVCPFKDASQVEGYSTTRLGSWDKFDDSYRLMLFSNGDKCWNGPDRSLKVRLRCGLKNEVIHVDEPSRCEYSAVLSTPLLCLEEKLKDLQNKLKLMNSGEALPHDEL
ncbi:unnamed protein product [Spirodela intermedia]|uniref:Glucosidase 2 subunit beta n=1 Tax=Spirodela intermedia TaxID=51605 RepID=A0A7I8JZ49_SPIIN|nr:unnamed protein product [Spirodela intermedia]